MFLTIRFNSYSRPQTANSDTFQVDVDANETVENLKALISLRFTDLDPDSFELYHKGKSVKNSQKCIYIQDKLRTNELEVVLNSRIHDCCTII